MTNLNNHFAFALINWRWGSTQAELMCARYLVIQGFTNVLPQSPFGGYDEGKDILFDSPSGKGVAGCYFPHAEKDFASIEAKFKKDLAGALKNNASTFYFFTGQRINLGQRDSLATLSPIPTTIVDHAAMLIYAAELAQFTGENPPSSPISEEQVKRQIDIGVLRKIVHGCAFFELIAATEQAPKRFGTAFFMTDYLDNEFYVGNIDVYDTLLEERVYGWWNAWEAVRGETRWHMEVDYNGDVIFPRDRQRPEDFELLKRIAGTTEEFREKHFLLHAYIREKYPEALLTT